MTPRQNKTLLALALVVPAAIVVFSVMRLGASGPQTPLFWQILIPFSVTSALLSYRGAEVNDRLLVSSSVMVLYSAGVVLGVAAAQASSAMGAMPAMTILAMSGFVSKGDFSERKVLRPLLNLSQLALTGATAGAAIDAVLSDRAMDVWTTLVGGSGRGVEGSIVFDSRFLLVVTVACAIGAAASTVVNAVGVRTALRIMYGAEKVLPWSGTMPIIGAQVAQSVVGGLLGFTMAAAFSVTLVPVVLVVYVIGNMVFTSYGTLRATHEAMLRGFVKILETRDLYTRGHTERVVQFSLATGRELGFSESQLARIRWAALIHDVGKLAVPTHIMRKQGALTDDEYRQMRVSTHKVDDMLSEVEFLAPMVLICSGVHPKLTAEDFGQTGHVHSRRATREQSVLAIADAFDAMTSTRSYRMAMSQTVALNRLAESNDPLFHPEVIEGLRKALGRMSGSYGPPELATDGQAGSEAVHA